MRKEILVMLLVIVSMGTFVSAQDTGQMLIIGNFEQSTVSITVPDTIELPTVIKGYSSSVDFDISNTGTTDLSVITTLVSTVEGEKYNGVFGNIELGRKNGILTDINEYIFALEKPLEIGIINTEIFTAKIDLRNIDIEDYSETEEVYAVFTAVPN